MTWMLTFFLLLPDGTTVVTEMGLMNGRDICETVGGAVDLRLRIETPEVRATWTCTEIAGVS